MLLTAGGHSNGPVELAAKLARDRARVVDIGKTRLDLPWNAYYDKELDVRFSRSYGPGRYDTRYELDGIDYPAGYVRWTERRNLGCFLDLLARKDIEVESLVSATFPIEKATSAYDDLASGTLQAVGVLLEYPKPETPAGPPATSRLLPGGQPAAPRPAEGRLAVGFIGAGSYATSMLLPHLAGDPAVRLAHVATNRSLSAVNAQQRFSFGTASTSADAVLEDASLDVIFIVTRHHTHAELVCRALETGKAVFVEKPLALTREEVERILGVIEKTGNDRLMVGFNRRFAPLLTDMRTRFGPQAATASTRYLVNAGRLDATSWYLNEELEGSRFAGEGGHFIDTLSWWADSLPTEVYAVSGADPADIQAVVRFANGATGTISYLTTGNPRFPKETLDAGAGGCSARLDNFARPASGPAGKRISSKARSGQDKGQRAELAALHRSGAGPAPRCRSRSSPWSPPRGHDRRRRRAWPAVARSRYDARSTGSRLGWYARRVSRMSPAEVAWRARDQALQLAWSARQVTPEPACGRCLRRPPGDRRFTRVPCRPVPPRRACPRRRGRSWCRPRTSSCAVSGKCWGWPGPIWRSPTGSAIR